MILAADLIFDRVWHIFSWPGFSSNLFYIKMPYIFHLYIQTSGRIVFFRSSSIDFIDSPLMSSDSNLVTKGNWFDSASNTQQKDAAVELQEIQIFDCWQTTGCTVQTNLFWNPPKTRRNVLLQGLRLGFYEVPRCFAFQRCGYLRDKNGGKRRNKMMAIVKAKEDI